VLNKISPEIVIYVAKDKVLAD